jgi:excisionase family DNA binding protein
MTTAPTPTNLDHALARLPSMLAPSEIATALKMTEDTITEWLSQGTLRGYKLGRVWRILKTDLIEDIARRYNVPDPRTPARHQRADRVR